ncbi:hypothetical protein [Caryophanon latum]|uniref:Uncharacterized protein n=1 Tax=Caryophanon latum TaxID=33977 RepID=A0A1C0YJC1_9BACL|nr:hypothetical protein [Caryophanon latum]OCS87241.1 hypothetical protein A6K76_02400 [Caryophanon latum]
MKKWLAALAAVSTICVIAPQAEAAEMIVQDGIHYEIFAGHNGKKEARVVKRELLFHYRIQLVGCR